MRSSSRSLDSPSGLTAPGFHQKIPSRSLPKKEWARGAPALLRNGNVSQLNPGQLNVARGLQMI